MILFEKNNYLETILFSFLAGLSVYSFLSYLFVALRITVPLSIVMSVLVFGLIRYYLTLPTTDAKPASNTASIPQDKSTKSAIVYVIIFTILIVITSFSHENTFHVFTKWQDISFFMILQAGAAIALCFFIPGFAIVLVIAKKYRINPVLAALLGYLLSMLITGLTAYISALTFDIATADSIFLFISVYVSIIVFFLIFYPVYGGNQVNRFTISASRNNSLYHSYHSTVTIIKKLYHFFKSRINEFIVFSSLFSLVVISTFYLYGGTTIGDQWYHQGRSLLFMSGGFKEAAIAGTERFYPPFQSALLAAMTVLSGMPIVNAYASIFFVNIMPVFAFYYFFIVWIPSSMRKAGLIAASLFTICSGFGWIYLLTTTSTSDVFSNQSSLETLRHIGHLDIISASNFVIATAPDFSTGLIYIALPAGFVLLAILRISIQGAAAKIAIVTAISVLGMITHYEFYIFIIIASVLPIIFRLKAANYIYLSFFFAFFIVFSIQLTTPGNYLTLLAILGFGFPMILLGVCFVTITWILYLTYSHISKTMKSIFSSLFFILGKRFQHYRTRINFHAAALVVTVVAYLYLLSFIVLGQLPLEAIIDHGSNFSVPWYLYPMKLGLVGLMGLIFVLAFIFKRFEKQVFVFGVIILAAFIAGPYYNEHRFAKYIMMGMIGFASLMIYDILCYRVTNRPIIKAAIVSIIITSSGLSIFAFVGYSSLILQTQDYTDTLPRRHFPTDSELRMFEVLHNNLNVNSKRYNVIGSVGQYDRVQDGLMSKIPGFVGVPYDKLLQSPLALNSSTLDILYRQLAFSDAHYLVIPKSAISDPSITESTHFALEHFRQIYQDGDFIVLEVPPLRNPSSSPNAKVALVYDEGKYMPERRLSHPLDLKFDNNTFDFKSDNLVNVKKQDQTEILDLSGSKSDGGISVWAKNVSSSNISNYIETDFQVISENEKKSNDIRVDWQEGGKQGYYVRFSNDGLELYKKSGMDKQTLLKNAELDKLHSKWYNLKIEILSNSINVYIDDILKISSLKTRIDNTTGGLSKLGLSTLHTDVQFSPVKLGTVTDSLSSYDNSTNHDFNYPITLLALTKLDYDTFSSKDLSTMSNEVVVIPDSLFSNKSGIDKYLDYASNGGVLVILSSHGNFSSVAKSAYSLRVNEGNRQAFTHISDNSNQLINVSGWVRNMTVEPLPNVKIISSYRSDKNETIAPFMLEKRYPTGGKIILLNSEGYFNAMSNFPKQYFGSLQNISNMLFIGLPESTASETTALPMEAFVGKMKINGTVTLNSSSLLHFNEERNVFPTSASRIMILDSDNNPLDIYNNVTIKDIRLIGEHNLNINFTGESELPGTSSYYDYIDMRIPSGFNMSLALGPMSSAYLETIDKGSSLTKIDTISNNSKLIFYGIKSESPLHSIPVLIKKPEINVSGHVNFTNAYLDKYRGYLTDRGKLDVGIPIDLEGKLLANISFVDSFNQPYRNSTKSQYITYLQSALIDGAIQQDSSDPKLPGDTYFKTKHEIHIVKIIESPVNIIVLSGLITAVVITIRLKKKKKILKS